jgi:hypothetical protein
MITLQPDPRHLEVILNTIEGEIDKLVKDYNLTNLILIVKKTELTGFDSKTLQVQKTYPFFVHADFYVKTETPPPPETMKICNRHLIYKYDSYNNTMIYTLKMPYQIIFADQNFTKIDLSLRIDIKLMPNI